MQGFGSLEQHLEGELTSPDMLDAHADQLLVVRNHHRLDRFQDLLGALLGQRNVPFDQLGLEPLQQCPASRLRRGRLEADRKSVVTGKSVSVRVDLGARRILKKKKK